MAMAARIHQLITATANDCQKIASDIMTQPQPKKEYRSYTTQINNMVKDEMWYLLGNPNWVPPIGELANRYDINPSSLKYYRKKLKEDVNWFPNQDRGIDQRMFTFEEEKEVVDELVGLAKKGVPITNAFAQNAFIRKMNKRADDALAFQRFQNRKFNASM